MAWKVEWKPSAIDDAAWFGKATGRKVFNESERRLSKDPLAESKNQKTLRPNPVAQRELRMLGKYRVLFNVDRSAEIVTIVLVGEKRGETLLVQGEEFTEHHESDTSQ